MTNINDLIDYIQIIIIEYMTCVEDILFKVINDFTVFIINIII